MLVKCMWISLSSISLLASWDVRSYANETLEHLQTFLCRKELLYATDIIHKRTLSDI